MAQSDSFKAFVLDQLHGMGAVTCRPMFGGYGLYKDGAFFGIVFAGRLYFRTTAKTVAQYHERGMQPFRPNAKMTLQTYYEVPVEIIEDLEQLSAWAEQAAAEDTASAGRRRGPVRSHKKNVRKPSP
jgi:DNA transformation protein and related proteins